MKITLISHCCTLIELGGKQILTDPWMTEPLYWGRLFHRYGVGMTIDELPPLDLIVASHGHDDHLDPGTLRLLDHSTPVLVLRKRARKVRRLGYSDIYPMVAGERYAQDGLTVHACFGKHPGGLITYVLEAGGEKVFFAGDTAYHDRLLEVGQEHGRPDVCLLPISGGRGLFGAVHYHLNPGEAAQVAGALRSRVVIPVHYHFRFERIPRFLARSMSVEGKLPQFVRAAADICPEVQVVTLGVGQTWESEPAREPGREPA
jgi:L-ascorbate metabolism protein UlaG (beta-lactamase superfamily)